MQSTEYRFLTSLSKSKIHKSIDFNCIHVIVYIVCQCLEIYLITYIIT